MMTLRLLLVATLVLISAITGWGQQQTALDRALRHLEEHREAWGLEQSDLNDLIVSDTYFSNHNGVQHIYLKQRYRGIPIFNALAGVHIRPDGEVLIGNQRLEANIARRVTTLRSASMPADRALQSIVQRISPEAEVLPRSMKSTTDQRLRFTGGDVSSHPITLELQYVPMPDGSLQLAWGTTIVEVDGPDAWLIHVDATTGAPLEQRNITVSCSFDHSEGEHCEAAEGHTTKAFTPVQQKLAGQMLADEAQYRVFPVPVEAPIFGTRELVVNPADPTASPFGWHDNNGREGAEFTTTRGNNVHAYLDVIPDNDPDDPNFPDGGEELIFDFPLDLNGTPDTYEEAVLTQMFYMNNVMHDFTYYYGFDENAGNFQDFNYGRGGRGTDFVRAETQDGSGLNNANFLTLPDGEFGRMQMFLWASSTNARVDISGPSVMGDNRFRFGTASFGPILRSELSGQVVAVISDDFDSTTGCSVFFNGNQVAGKIALINRGECAFEEKVKNAEAAGAIGVIIANTENNILAMGGTDTIPDPSIPSVSIASSSGAILRDALNGGTVNVTIEVPDYLDSGFDNGVIAHEYGHGISNRLTGGPSEAFCLFNDEQMGEGWSDFFALVTTVRPDDTGELPRGIGNYVTGRDIRGRGIRRQPYSTDLAINDQTYDDIIGTNAPHPLGEIWAATLWDLYWALVDEYGYDPDLYTGTGGNNIAIQLVMDGMKLQECRPGFIDGRDAIMAADAINNNGANECLLWEVFARRGLGWNADQGSSGNRNDNIENYNVRPECIREVKIEKTSTPLIAAGDTFQIQLVVTNDKLETVTDVMVSDLIPANATLLPNTLAGGQEVSITGNEVVFSVGRLLSGQSIQLSYELVSDPSLASRPLFIDDMESGIGGWRLRSRIGQEGWRLSDDRSNSGSFAWYVPNSENEQDQSLQLLRAVPLTNGTPVLRFYHSFDIEPGLDGAILETATDGGFSWDPLSEEAFIRQGYTGRIAPRTLGESDLDGFWGGQPDFQASYVDLAAFLGEDFSVRFRFGANQETSQNPLVTEGWYVDDVAIFDMVNYQSEACVTTAEGDQTCAEARQGGTIVEVEELTTSTEELVANAEVSIFPNPAISRINVQLSEDIGNYHLEILSIDGRTMLQRTSRDLRSSLDVSALPAGIYVLSIETETDRLVRRMVIEAGN